MKKLLFSFAAIASLSLLLVPGSSIAEPTHPNEVGLYMNEDGTGATGTYVIGAPVTVYLVLTKPSDVENGNAPYPTINAFECMLTFSPFPTTGLFYMGATLPPGSINVGYQNYSSHGEVEFIVGIPYDVPVTDESVVLATLLFLNMASTPTYVTLSPVDWPSIPGQMAFQSVQGDLMVMHPISGSHEAPVFIFNGEAVAVETESFGSVKALFR